jgi:epsin
LLSNTDKIRAERKLAKKNRNKYIGVGSETGMRSMGGFSGGIGSSGSRYTGFGSDSYSGGGGLSFNGDAMSYGETPYPHQGNKYDEDEDEEGGYHSESNGSFGKEVYGFDSKKQTDDDDDWGDFTCGGAIEEPSTSNKIIDDDFADFQHAVPMEEPTASATTATTATTTTTTTTTTKQNKPQQQQDLFDLLDNDTPIVSTAANTTQPPLYMFDTKQPITPSGYHSQPQQSQPKPAEEEKKVSTPSTPTGMWAQASNFVSLDSLGKNTSNSMPAKGPSMNALKSNSVQADWNNWASNNSTPKPSPAPAATKTSSAFDDLLSL